MKRLLALLLAVVFCALCGCRTEQQRFEDICYKEQPAINLNYNNTHPFMQMDWLTKEAVFFSYSPYHSAPLGPLYHCFATADGAEKISCSGSSFYAYSQAYGDIVYLLEEDPNSSTESNKILRIYNLQDKHMEEFGALGAVNHFFVLGDYLYLLVLGIENEEIVHSVVSVSLKTKTRTTIAPSALDIGVINNQPAYVVQDDNTYSVYTYDVATGSSRQLGSFAYALTGEEWDLDMVNFTSDSVIRVVTDQKRSRLLQYNWERDQLTEYRWDVVTDFLIAYEDYAFALVREDGYSHLYRICLTNGERELLATIPGRAQIFVTSDTDVYVSSSENGDIIHYNSAGEQELVCDF